MTDEIRTARFHDGERYKCVLARPARKLLHLTFINDGIGEAIVHRAVPLDEQRNLQPLPFKGGEYPLARMVKRFRAIGRERGITEAAKAELKLAIT